MYITFITEARHDFSKLVTSRPHSVVSQGREARITLRASILEQASCFATLYPAYGLGDGLADVTSSAPRIRTLGYLGGQCAGQCTTMKYLLGHVDLDAKFDPWVGRPRGLAHRNVWTNCVYGMSRVKVANLSPSRARSLLVISVQTRGHSDF